MRAPAPIIPKKNPAAIVVADGAIRLCNVFYINFIDSAQ
jgi:hypothetical protein